MKKSFLSFIIIFIFTAASAQTKFGYKIGLNAANIANASSHNTIMPALNTGLFSNLYFSDKYFLDAELLLSIKGYNSILIPAGTTSHRLSYISVPVLMGFQASKKISFVVGPEINFLTKGIKKNGTDQKTITHRYNNQDLGIDAGVGYNFSKKIKLDLRYNYGLSKVIKEAVPDNSGDVMSYKNNGFNRVIQLDLSFIF